MSVTSAQTAADLINSMAEDELYELLVNNAQEEKARDIARAIVANRPVNTTKELADLVMTVYGNRRGHLHPATKTFQAIRIAVNQELKIIKPAIKDAFSLLKIGGKLAVISFHEGEDRIVKRTFLELVNEGVALQTGKQPIVPDNQEIAANQRARSAKLRIIERLQMILSQNITKPVFSPHG
jgi:16S rRNA (cytosine1402-N4)-methyltransferase